MRSARKMLIATTKLALVILLMIIGAILAASYFLGGRADERHTLQSTALSDGFEVLVIEPATNGHPLLVESPPIEKAHDFLSEHPSSTLKVQGSDVGQIEKILSRAGSGNYPIVVINTKDGMTGNQGIEVNFSYSGRSFSYAYRTDGKNVWPIWVSHSDLSGKSKVIYD